MMLYGDWARLPIQTRIKLAEIFGIKKVGPTHVADNHVQSDGYRIDDVETALTVEAMQNYTGAEHNNVQELWSLTVDKVNGKTYKKEPQIVPKVVIKSDSLLGNKE